MAQPWAKQFYDSAVWQKQRAYILKRDRHLCTEPGCHNVATEVHHIVELTAENVRDNRIALDESNLRSLCHDCHTRITRAEHGGREEILERIAFDANGNPVSVSPFRSRVSEFRSRDS